MLYAILGRDAPDSLPRRLAARPAHLARIVELKEAGRLVLAGPHPQIDSPEPGPGGMAGSLIVADFASLEAAQDWAEADPYVTAGVFARVEVLPFIQVLP